MKNQILKKSHDTAVNTKMQIIKIFDYLFSQTTPPPKKRNRVKKTKLTIKLMILTQKNICLFINELYITIFLTLHSAQGISIPAKACSFPKKV